MNRKVVLLAVIAGLCLGVSEPGAAAQRKHKPWFSHASEVSSPLVGEDERSSGGGDKKLSSAPHLKSSPTRGEETAAGRKVVRQALRYKGAHYKFGGTSPRGMDCSGLVSRVWSDLKMKKIPRVSSALYNSGRPVHLSELRPGDLVFFKDTYKPGISHVGVYTGNNKFVHAANHHKGVTIARLSDPYYQLHYAGARRLY